MFDFFRTFESEQPMMAIATFTLGLALFGLFYGLVEAADRF
ncbi:hypothetical protein EP7_000899 [Isosphaeraceae bacterium EP7]